MCKRKNLETRNFEGQEVGFRIGVDGQSEVRINEVAKFCGWTQIKKEKEYIRWETVKSYLNELGYSQQVGKGDFIPEYIMYPLIGKANNERATKFMLWVGKVLTEIRANGGYIASTATKKQVNELNKKWVKQDKVSENTLENMSLCNLKNVLIL
jgi:prophage antirepressor-like protein